MTAHLLQSTVFAGIAALLAFAFRKQRAGVRYWIWLAGSLKFLIPFAVLIEIGTHIPWPAAMPAARPHFTISAPDASRPLVKQPFLRAEARPAFRSTGVAELVAFALWISGAAAVVFFWMREWRRMRQIVRSGVPLPLDAPIRAVSVATRVEPGVSGVTGAELRKRIEDIMKGKAFQPLNAARKFVLATAGALAIVLPLLIGFAIAPQTAAQSESAKPAAFEVASIKLSKNPDPRSMRMQFQPGGRFSTTAIPLRLLVSEAYGIPFQSPRILTSPEFDAAMPALAPGQFDIEAVAPQGAIPAGASEAVQAEIMRRMLQSLLADRFKLVVRRETKDLPVYAIVIGKNGPKLKKSDVQAEDCASRIGKPDVIPCHEFNGGRGRGLHTDAANITDVAQFVENWAGRPVVDKTGLTGLFNIQTTGWRPQEAVPIQPRPDGLPPSAEQQAFADPSTPTLFDIFEQLGLKLEAQRATVETLTLVSIQRPTEN